MSSTRESDAGIAAVERLRLALGILDVENCFHRLVMPAWLSEYFGFPRSVRASDVNLAGESLDGEALRHDELIFPCARPFPMGFSWSLFFCQKIAEARCREVSSLSCSRLMQDHGSVVVFKTNSLEPQHRHYVYVDNLGVLGAPVEHVSRIQKEVGFAFDSVGLQTHESEIVVDDKIVLCVGIDLKHLRTYTCHERFWKIRGSLQAIIRRGRCSGWVLEIILGHCTFAGLVNRDILCCFHTVYAFIEAHYNHHAKIWSSVIEELQAYVGLMIYLRSDWWLRWNRFVYSSDSSLYGFGVCTSEWTRDVVARVGRVSERSCFKNLTSVGAREAALGPMRPFTSMRLLMQMVLSVTAIIGNVCQIFLKYRPIYLFSNFGNLVSGALGSSMKIFLFLRPGL
mgnify:CR=1 FL=1